jgi:MATE family multidrug resistance protein
MTAGLGLGVTFTAFFGLTILIGTNCAQETLTSHAFGAKELRRCGVLLNRGRVILTAVYIPIALVFAFSRELLVMIGQDAEVAYHAGEFIKYQIVGIYFIGQFDLTKRWLTQCQVAWVPLIAMIICTVMHVGWCWLYMVHYGLGMLGAGLANATSALIMWIIVTIISLTVSELKDALFWPDRESFSRWGEYLAISIPVTIMICAEVGVFNVFVIMSGYLGVVDQAAQVILMCLNELMFMAALGFMEATCSLVGSSIGAKNVTLAKRISKLTFAVSFSTCMVVLVFM